MIQTFALAPTNPILATPATAGGFYARSGNAADTGNLILTGPVSGTPTAETLALTGQRELLFAGIFSSLSFATLSAAQAGTVSIYGTGTAGNGRILALTQPAEGGTLTIGLTGFTQAYTFRARGSSTVVCYATAGLTQGDYFDIALSGSTRRFWYDIDAAGTGIPADPGGGLSMISIATGDADTVVATATEAVIEAVTNLASTVAVATITIDYEILGVMTVTDGPGDAVGAITVVAAGTADAAYQVALGADATASMVNLRRAIRDGDAVRGDGTGEGTLYGTGTVANPYQDITAISGTILTTTDLLAVERSLAWSYAQSAAAFSLQVPIGGTDGTLLASIQTGNTLAANAITLDDEGLTLELLPALLPFVSDWIAVLGRGASLYLQSENVTTAMVTSYDIATVTGYPIAGSAAIADMDNNVQVINIPERASFLRLKINNTNTTPSSVNAKIVAG